MTADRNMKIQTHFNWNQIIFGLSWQWEPELMLRGAWIYIGPIVVGFWLPERIDNG